MYHQSIEFYYSKFIKWQYSVYKFKFYQLKIEKAECTLKKEASKRDGYTEQN